jgi:hypothetical protein
MSGSTGASTTRRLASYESICTPRAPSAIRPSKSTIAPSAIDVDPGSGRARLRAATVPVTDYHDFFNAVLGAGPTPLPSHVSFDVRWQGKGGRQEIRDETFGFTGHYVTSATTISFRASNDGSAVSYTPDPSGQYNVGSPAVGHERNGVFFH